MKYIEPEIARNMPGLRLALSVGVPGPFSESAKAVFRIKQIPFIPVAQRISKENAALAAWTGLRNAPVAIYEGEPPRHSWLDIVLLAERLCPTPALLPADSFDRALAVGLSSEICGEGGLSWSRRIGLFTTMGIQKSADPVAMAMTQAYGIVEERIPAAKIRVAGILRMLAGRLKAQHREGSPYFVGGAFTMTDLHWAYFSVAIDPLPHEVNPMPRWLRDSYVATFADMKDVFDPILIEHRDRMFRDHLTLPLDFKETD